MGWVLKLQILGSFIAFFLENVPYYEWGVEAGRSGGLHASHPGVNTSEGWPACYGAQDLFSLLYVVPSPVLTSSEVCSREEQGSSQGLLIQEAALPWM